MEQQILKSLLDKEFYNSVRGDKCPNQIFTKDLKKIKEIIDYAMEEYQRDLTLDEVQGLFFSKNPTLTTSQKHQFKFIFKQIANSSVVGADIASEILSGMFRVFVGEEIANIGFQCVNGDMSTMQPIRNSGTIPVRFFF